MKINSKAIISELRLLYPFPWGYASRVAANLGIKKMDVYNVVYGISKHKNTIIIEAIAEDVKERKRLAAQAKNRVIEAATL